MMTKAKLYFFLLSIFSIQAFSQETETTPIIQTVVSSGVGLGTVLAVVTSWERNKSVLLAIIHGIFSWLYVIYFVLTRQKNERK
ncbi:MAG: hypothetical protein ACTH3E_05955 [Psychroflexus halocasei]